MIFIPLPFVVALLLFLLLVKMISEGGRAALARPFFVLTGGYALLSVFIGLRWGYGMTVLLPLMSILAASLAPLAWIAFQQLSSAGLHGPRNLIHAIPVVIVVLLIAVLPQIIDFALAAIYLTYGTTLLRLAARGSDGLDKVPLEYTTLVHRSLVVTGTMLLLSAIVDALVAIDFARAGGVHAAGYVAVANLMVLLVLGVAAATAGRTQPTVSSEDWSDEPASPPSTEDINIVTKIDTLVTGKQLFKDPELTLNRLSRRALIPARRVSEAINRSKGQSVSQYINGHRVAAACDLLSSTGQSITAIMFEVGFQTKSNFNREFRRQTGSSPADWRLQNTAAAAALMGKGKPPWMKDLDRSRSA